MALPPRPIRRCLRLRAYRHSAVDGRVKSTFASFVIKNILRRERVFRTGGGTSAPDMQWERAPRVEMGILWADEGKAVRGAVLEMCEAFGASRWVSRSGKALALGDLLHRIAATFKQAVRVILIVGTSCPKAGLPRNRATRCGADRSVSEGYGEEGWSHRG